MSIMMMDGIDCHWRAGSFLQVKVSGRSSPPCLVLSRLVGPSSHGPSHTMRDAVRSGHVETPMLTDMEEETGRLFREVGPVAGNPVCWNQAFPMGRHDRYAERFTTCSWFLQDALKTPRFETS